MKQKENAFIVAGEHLSCLASNMWNVHDME